MKLDGFTIDEPHFEFGEEYPDARYDEIELSPRINELGSFSYILKFSLVLVLNDWGL